VNRGKQINQLNFTAMKKLMTITLALLVAGIVNAQQMSYEEAIKESLEQFSQAKAIEDIHQVASKLQRIASVESKRWEAHYFHAYVLINSSFWEKDGKNKDLILDQAQVSIDKGLELKGDKSELNALQGFLYQGRIQVSASRGMTYSSKASSSLEQAIAENPKNPRAYFLLGQNIYNTPSMFGGGKKNALPMFQKAKDFFELEKNKQGFEINWGAIPNERLLEKCISES
jgi:hypothetical protein